MRTLVFWGEGPLARARAQGGRRSEGPALGTARGPPHRRASPHGRLRSRGGVANRGGRAPMGGQPAEQPIAPESTFRELFVWEGEPLFPAARRFFFSAESVAGRCVRLVEAFRVVLEKELPDEVEAFGLLEDEVRLLERSCTARGVLFQGGAKSRVPRAGEGLRGAFRPGLADRVRALRSALPAAKPRLPGGAVVFVRPEEPSEKAQALERLRRVAAEELAMRVVALGGEEGPAPEVFLDEAGRQAVAAGGGGAREALPRAGPRPLRGRRLRPRRRALRRPGRGLRPGSASPRTAAPRRAPRRRRSVRPPAGRAAPRCALSTRTRWPTPRPACRASSRCPLPIPATGRRCSRRSRPRRAETAW